MPNLPQVQTPTGLPTIDPLALEHSQKTQDIIAQYIKTAGGNISFEKWMQMALYQPGFGYYSAGSTKFNAAGDFTTAPETSSIFGQTLSRQILQILELSDSNNILEFGAGTGALAQSIIQHFKQLGKTVKYQILELSADLRQRQQQALAEFADQVVWLDTLPNEFTGCVIANEVLDAMAVNIFNISATGELEILGVSNSTNANTPFVWSHYPATPELINTIQNRTAGLSDYTSEINLQAEAWVQNMGHWLKRGAAILIDYGFPRHEYYHPQRKQGTLMCHLRHHAHDQPLIYPGIQDITAHVDFTAMADAALEGGLDVLGYTSQARFLLNCGLTDILTGLDSSGINRAQQLAQINTLISEAEMGELFKVIAIGKDIEPPLLGFMRSDRRDFL